ncbi:mitochondrial outer membrane protein porin 2-like [Phragmites australis]|uniref:mitochondrial outer membrane protein porin 2-like n=1 Tax=Phragmites australis TaxID=29695 RepID=UPI002D772591|nr:mitochondrial outer membrane protein porin 2-like [Phragmites australis]
MAAAGPGLYSEIGKKARDLLYKDYHTDQKFTLTTYASNGAAITAAGTRKDEAIFSEIQSQLKNNNLTVDVKATSESNVITTFTIHELGTPGLKAILCIPFPYQKSAKAELQYLHHHAGITASVGLNAKPALNLSGVFGTKAFAVGADAAFDTSTGDLTKYNAGLSFTSDEDFVAAVTLNNKCDTIAASYYHSVNPSTAVGGELAHSFSSNGNTLTFGTQHALDPLTTVKTRFNNYGMASALVQHEWRPKSFLTVSTEVDTKAIEKSSKVGLSLVLKP